MTPINEFLLRHDLRIAQNPCVSPDFCLAWPALAAKLRSGAALQRWSKSGFRTAAGAWTLAAAGWPASGDRRVEAPVPVRRGGR